MGFDEQVRTEWLILADTAEVVGGKLYMMGGGWDVLNVNTGFPIEQRCGIAVGFRVPWSETNRKIPITVEISTDDGASLGRVDGQIEVGRPPGIPQGSSQLTQLAINIGLRFEKPGEFVLSARSEGEEESKRFPFRVIPGPGMMLRQQLEGR